MSIEVAITGVGAVSSLGLTADASAEAWRQGNRATVETCAAFENTPLANAKVACLPDFDPAPLVGGRRSLRYMSDAAVLGCIAAREALRDTDSLERHSPEKIGLYASVGQATLDTDEVLPIAEASLDENGSYSHRLLGTLGLQRCNPLLSFKILANMPVCLISILENIKGPSLIFTPWEGQTGAAFLESWHAIKAGRVSGILTGGADAAASSTAFVSLTQRGHLGTGEYPASGAAYLFFENAQSMNKDRHPYAIIKDIRLTPCSSPPDDPLAERMGRSFAAAPAMQLALAAKLGWRSVCITGVDGMRLEIELEPCS